MNHKSIVCILMSVFLVCVFSFNVHAGDVEVLHRWTSGGEAASVAVLKKLLEKEGQVW